MTGFSYMDRVALNPIKGISASRGITLYQGNKKTGLIACFLSLYFNHLGRETLVSIFVEEKTFPFKGTWYIFNTIAFTQFFLGKLNDLP